VALVGSAVTVRDSKDQDGPAPVFTAREWAAFVGGVTAARGCWPPVGPAAAELVVAPIGGRRRASA
jgi:hypothetical protein